MPFDVKVIYFNDSQILCELPSLCGKDGPPQTIVLRIMGSGAALDTKQKSPLSVCMVSAAEAGRIGRALESVAGWTSEIIVILNEEVHDATEEIALKSGAKVFREPWKGMIRQKSSAAQKAASDWVLDLDADEEVSPELREEIQVVLADREPASQFAAFSYPRLSWYCGRWIRHGDWYPDRQNRLWRRGRGTWGGTDPHAKLLVDGPVKRLRGNLRHFSYLSMNHHLQKIAAFSDEFVRQQLPTGRQSSALDLVFRPCWRFFRGYVIRLGFLDGWQGYCIARHIAFETMLRYAKLREARQRANSQTLPAGKV
jgi:glycosyltransferase involved in cell wall biosynthesis